MDSPTRISNHNPQQLLSPCTTATATRTSADSNSPEFEFWMIRNPSFPQPNLLSADELFVDGVLLPLHLLHLHNPQAAPEEPPNTKPEPDVDPGPQISSTITATESTLTASRRWKDLFKKTASSTKNQQDIKDKDKDKGKDKEKKREKNYRSGASSAELNINIWPFSRSRSAGTSGTRSRMIPGATRKVSSAPCSRSNSGGESKSRKWPSSPGRAGVHLGRSSPVWQVRRSGNGLKSSSIEAQARGGEKMASKKEGIEGPRRSKNANSGKTKALNLNVPMCIGYRQHLSCRTYEDSAINVGKRDGEGDSRSGGSATMGVGNSGNLFNLRSLFTKKVY